MRPTIFATLFAASSLMACGGPAQNEKPQTSPQSMQQAQNEGDKDCHCDKKKKKKHAEGRKGHHGEHKGHHKGPHGKDGHPEGAHKHKFKAPEEWATRWNDPSRDAWQKPSEVISLMEITPGMQVADLGAGTGYMLPHLAKAAGAEGSVLALDIQPEMLTYLEARVAKEGWTTVKPTKVPMDGPGLDAASLDRLVTLNTWHHIQDREAYAAKVKEVLKPGGLFMIVDYTLEAEPGPPKAYRLAPEAVVKELQAGGLDAKIATETLPKHYIIIGRKPAQ